MNRRSFFSIFKAAPVAAAVSVPSAEPEAVKLTAYGGWKCECGYVIWNDDHYEDKYPHTMRCVNPHCRHFGRPLKVPTFETRRA